MEILNIPLSQLTLAQKLGLMEAIWDDLYRDEKVIESPPWHEEILRDPKNTNIPFLMQSYYNLSDYYSYQYISVNEYLISNENYI
ncbi:MAG: addiction module protein [Desulfobacteraceae bacterium]|nr:addiction module protein [Desulfobacteraceae bacterium]